MLSMTHVKMAKLLGKALQIPDLKSFLKGMKYPDTGLKPFRVHHTKENTLYELKILLETNNSKWITPEAFSYNMGVILHYVSDYFCMYHENEYVFAKSIKHTIHEIKLELLWNWSYQTRIENFLRKIVLMHSIEDLDTFDTIKFLDVKLRECYMLPPSLEKDLDYAFTTSYTIGMMELCRWHFKKPK